MCMLASDTVSTGICSWLGHAHLSAAWAQLTGGGGTEGGGGGGGGVGLLGGCCELGADAEWGEAGVDSWGSPVVTPPDCYTYKFLAGLAHERLSYSTDQGAYSSPGMNFSQGARFCICTSQA